MAAEREIKLDVDDAFELPDLEGAAGGAGARDAGASTYDTTWFDTTDLRLARWGASLRFRDGEGWTVKLDPVADGGGVLTRGEHRFDPDDGDMPGDAVDLVRAYARTEDLRPVVRATTTRRRIELVEDDRPVAEVVDDAVEVTQAPAGATRFRELEVEVSGDASPDVARDVARTLREAGARDGGRTKVERALGGRPPPEFDVPSVGRGATIEDVVRAAIAGPVERLLRHDPGVRIGADPEDVHKARVATRRLRSTLKTFREWLDPEWATDLRSELGWIAHDLGAVRDADVMLARLAGRVAALGDDDRPVAAALVERLSGARDDARAGLLASMRSARYLQLAERLVDAARAPALAGATEVPAEALARVMEGPWKKLRRAVERLDDEATDGDLHAARIRAKRARYAAEAVQPAFRRANAFVRSVTELQDVLGEHQDAVVLEAWLRDSAASAAPRQSFVAGELAAAERRARDAARAAWPRAWRPLSRKRIRFWT
jgi:CHAD domain-containing protein